MNARVVGGTYDGGTLVMVERADGSECEVVENARGRLSVRFELGEVPATLGELMQIEQAARAALNNYGGPSDNQMAGQYAACEPRDVWNGR